MWKKKELKKKKVFFLIKKKWKQQVFHEGFLIKGHYYFFLNIYNAKKMK